MGPDITPPTRTSNENAAWMPYPRPMLSAFRQHTRRIQRALEKGSNRNNLMVDAHGLEPRTRILTRGFQSRTPGRSARATTGQRDPRRSGGESDVSANCWWSAATLGLRRVSRPIPRRSRSQRSGPRSGHEHTSRPTLRNHISPRQYDFGRFD